MEFFQFLQRESKEFDRKLLIAAAFAGIVNTLLIFILTDAAGKMSAGKTPWIDLAMVALCLAAFWICKSYLLRRTTRAVEDVIKNVRLRIAGKIRNTDLTAFEGIERAALYNAISTHTVAISRLTPAISSAASSAVLLICAFLVIYFLSSTAFLILAGTLGFIIMFMLATRTKTLAVLNRVIHQDNRFVRGFGDLLDGFKELKMNSEKNEDFHANHLEPEAEKSRAVRVEGLLMWESTMLVASSALFLLLTAVVFLVPLFCPSDAPNLVRVSMLIVFIMGPLSEVVAVYSPFTEATAAVGEITRIEKRLDSVFETGHGDPLPKELAPLEFRSIRCENIAFSYRNDQGEPSFSLEPFNFHLGRPEIVFITGGNGSGKSTFFKILAGLYAPATGGILVNEAPVGPQNRQAYRNLFAPIFSDFHLFDFLYGVKEVNDDTLNALLHLTDLLNKTSVVERRLTTTHLSTGQRKRLALVLALMEDKPILLLDEWAAEQDPQFRRKFYREILPDLRKHGKSVVAVSHDDDHYDVADRVLKMQYGKFVPLGPAA